MLNNDDSTSEFTEHTHLLHKASLKLAYTIVLASPLSLNTASSNSHNDHNTHFFPFNFKSYPIYVIPTSRLQVLASLQRTRKLTLEGLCVKLKIKNK